MRVAAAAPLLLALLVLSGGAAAVEGPPADLVDALPEQPDGAFNVTKLYSGYLPLAKDSARQVFYNFYPSEAATAVNDSLILWLQGGPGCSSVGVAAFQQVGPFVFEAMAGPAGVRNVTDLRLTRNIGSWTAFAHMLFIDTPAPTGFSTGTGAGSWGDANTTADDLAALLAFYDKFPSMRGRPLFLAGQGYAGHTVPQLAQEIRRRNDGAQAPGDRIALRGILVGNPWVEPEQDNRAAVAFWYENGLISGATHADLLASCDMRHIALWRTEGSANLTDECEEARTAALQEAYPAADLWGTNGPRCVPELPANVTELTPAELLPLEGEPDPEGITQPREQQPNLKLRPGGLPQTFFDPCASWRVWQYMNRDDVQEALHAIKAGEAAREWRACDPAALDYSLQDILAPQSKLFKELAEAGVRVLVFSGKTDGVMPTGGTRGWVEGLGLRPFAGAQQPLFRTWYDRQGFFEPAGTLEMYANLTLATVLEAGHHAPYFKPLKMLQLARAFVNNRLAVVP